MKTFGIPLCWIVVKDIEAAIAFYTNVVGLKLKEHNKQFNWAELSGPEGARLGLAQENPADQMKAGTNAVLAIHVDDIEKAKSCFSKKGVHMAGEIMEIPGEVKLQTFFDTDGNMGQLVQVLRT